VTVKVLPTQAVARQRCQQAGIDLLVERLAELRPFDLVLEFVEIDEFQRVAQRSTAHGGADLHLGVSLAVAIGIDVDRGRARAGIGRNHLAGQLDGIGPWRAGLLARVAILGACLVGARRGERHDVFQVTGALLQIGYRLRLPDGLDLCSRVEGALGGFRRLFFRCRRLDDFAARQCHRKQCD
jgi:hypothetical protein